MGRHVDQDVVYASAGEAPADNRVEPRRINVAVSPETVRAIERLIENEGVTLTEALRRLVGYGDFVYRALREHGEQVLVTGPDGTREVLLL